jgi:hypothetical protein
MRGLGRFGTIRCAVSGARSLLHSAATRRRIDDCRERLPQTLFTGVDPERFVSQPQRDGVAFGLKLPTADVAEIRRYTDEEISSEHPANRVVEICAPAGTGFAEDTLCIHKGLTPTRTPRLLLQVQYALFDYGVMHDRRAPSELRSMA